jgi:hypothetical protein
MDVTKSGDYMKNHHKETRGTIEKQVLHKASRINKNNKEGIFEKVHLCGCIFARIDFQNNVIPISR